MWYQTGVTAGAAHVHSMCMAHSRNVHAHAMLVSFGVIFCMHKWSYSVDFTRAEKGGE